MDRLQCVSFPVRRSTSPVFYATNIVLAPVIYGVGLIGNLLLILMLQRRYLRKESAVYVYLTAIGIVDVFSLFVHIPGSLRDVELLPINASYSKAMAYTSWVCYGADFVFCNASSWFLVFACVARYISARWPFSPRRFTRISSSRIAVFTLFMFSAMLNFPRFFEIAAVQVQGHCFDASVELWTEQETSFSRRPYFTEIYPWLTVSLSYLLPMLMIGIFACLLGHYTGWSHLRPSTMCRNALRKPRNEDERQVQLTVSVFVIVISYFVLELANILKQLFLAVYGKGLSSNKIFYEYTLISDCLSLIRCTLNLFHLSLFNHDFRKTFTRTFCFLCSGCMGDEYYEGLGCCKKTEDPVFSEKDLEDIGDGPPGEDAWLNSNGHFKSDIQVDETSSMRDYNDGWV